MIPVLYNKSETTFTHNGVGLLSEAVKATVTEERNGSYELSLQYPITGRFYSEITEGAIIKAKANETSEPQLFRIYKRFYKSVPVHVEKHFCLYSYNCLGCICAVFPLKAFSKKIFVIALYFRL